MDFLDQLTMLKEQIKFNEKLIFNSEEFDNIVIAGMGGSGIIGRIFSEIYSQKPVVLVDDYHIPKFINSKTFFVAISFSGNTEETLNAAKEAEKKHAYVSIITRGGKLEKHGDYKIILPKTDFQPRAGIGYMLMPFLNGFKIAKTNDIENTYNVLSRMDRNNTNEKKHAAQILNNNAIPLIYGSAPFKAIAYRWKTQFNENAKIMSFSNYFPELNHNEILGIKNHNTKYYFFVFDSAEKNIRKRIYNTSKITQTKFNIVKIAGKSIIEKLFYLIHYGDYVTYHLAVLKKIDALNIKAIEQLKKEMQK